jgi:hypothetical protein
MERMLFNPKGSSGNRKAAKVKTQWILIKINSFQTSMEHSILNILITPPLKVMKNMVTNIRRRMMKIVFAIMKKIQKRASTGRIKVIGSCLKMSETLST